MPNVHIIKLITNLTLFGARFIIMHYPLIDHTEVVLPPSRRYSICTIIGYLIVASAITGFTFSDIVVAYSYSPCYQTDAPYRPFPVQIWLAFSGYLGAVLCISCLFYHGRGVSACQRFILLLNDTLLIMMLLWNVMGIIILLLHYKEYLNCSIGLTVYLIVRLSVGICVNTLQYYLDYQPRPPQ
jgi:hypothetical protein